MGAEQPLSAGNHYETSSLHQRLRKAGMA